MTAAEKELADKLNRAALRRELEKEHEFPLYSVQVVKEGIYNPPFCYPDDQLALETFLAWRKSHPEAEDYRLFRLGSYNMITGKFTTCPRPVCLFNPKNKKVKK